jgi:protoheme IX farnesyltransferase
MAGSVYLFGALAAGLVFAYAAVRVAFDRTAMRARRLLLTSVIYLPVIYGLLLIDRPRL